MSQNALKKIRESLMISRTELARKANLSPLTIARIENEKPCIFEPYRHTGQQFDTADGTEKTCRFVTSQHTGQRFETVGGTEKPCIFVP